MRSRWWRGFIALAGAVAVLSMVAAALAPGAIVTTPDHPDGVRPGLDNPVGVPAGVVRDLAAAGLFVLLIIGLVALANVGIRFLTARGTLRAQLKWVAITQLVALPLSVLVTANPHSPVAPPLAILQTLGLQIVIVVAILRWRLYGVKVAVRRSLLAVSLLVAALGVYVVVVGVVATAVGQSGRTVSAVGAVVTALVFGPLSGRIRTWVDRVFYGRRRDPYAIVGVLVRRLGEVTAPEDALAGIAGALGEELRLPYVGIVSALGTPLARQGHHEGADGLHVFELRHQGRVVGELHVAHRGGETQLSPQDEQLLADLARHVGAAVDAVSLVADLRRARDRLVHAREDERRRLQRDLHDGLGPRLTAVGMMVDAASNQVSRRPDDARLQLQSARAELGAAVDDIRRIINQLGDPALDSLGLVGALRDRAARFGHDHLRVTVDAAAVPPLPAAVEVAAYRIASEALANVARHADASACTIRIEAGSSLRMTITDDGHGFDSDWSPGVGLASMRRRAGDLGGECRVGSRPEGGTEITVELPLASVAVPPPAQVSS